MVLAVLFPALNREALTEVLLHGAVSEDLCKSEWLLVRGSLLVRGGPLLVQQPADPAAVQTLEQEDRGARVARGPLVAAEGVVEALQLRGEMARHVEGRVWLVQHLRRAA